MSAPASSVDIDGAIRHLLVEQAAIQSRLAVLVASQHGLDLPLELDMLRHKLRIVKALVDEHGSCPGPQGLPIHPANVATPVRRQAWRPISLSYPRWKRPAHSSITVSASRRLVYSTVGLMT